MSEELGLVAELAIILVAAGLFTIISRALKQPPILGYIIAGFLVGPNLGLLPQLDSEAIHEWSEIGIIFLLFGLGLEFSFKKLMKIGSSALITAGVKCIGMFAVGIVAGKAMGWTSMEGIFLGGLLSMSSTTIIIKAYGDMGLKDRPYATLIFGSLVFEDLIAVLLMVLLSTLAVTGKFAGGEMLMGLAKLVFFLVLWFVVGIYLIPLILRKAKKYLNNEILLLVAIGLCFLMVVLANIAGFSSALGAFVMGSILAETVEGERIEHITGSIKDLFGAIFFVSVGMMVDPAVIAEHWLPIVIITLVAIAGILVFSTLGALLAGQGLNTAVHAGFTLAQLGEFAFIIAGLGCSMGVMRDFIYPVVIAVSVITTFTTPYMIKFGDPAAAWLEKHLPAKVLARVDRKQEFQAPVSQAEKSEWGRLLKTYALRVVLYSVVLVAIMLILGPLIDKLTVRLLPEISEVAAKWIKVILMLLVMTPFFSRVAISGRTVTTCGEHLVQKNPNNRYALLALIYLRVMIVIAFVIWLFASHFELSWWVILLIAAAIAAFVFLVRKSKHQFSSLEDTFIGNFNEKEILERRKSPVTAEFREKLDGYGIHIEPVVVSPEFEYIGKTLREMPFRKTTGINIVKIQRGSKSVIIPSGSEPIYPGDLMLAAGTPDQLAKFNEVMKNNTDEPAAEDKSEFIVDTIVLTDESGLTGNTLRSSNMRASGCMVVSVLRDGVLHTNPSAEFQFKSGDVLWLAGEKNAVEWYK